MVSRLWLTVLGTVAVLGLAGCAHEQTLANNSATRTFDRAAGTDVSGAYPGQANGTPNNPPGTAASRTFDRAAGTDTSGAYPNQADGTPANPPGTAAGRAWERATGSSGSSMAPPTR